MKCVAIVRKNAYRISLDSHNITESFGLLDFISKRTEIKIVPAEEVRKGQVIAVDQSHLEKEARTFRLIDEFDFHKDPNFFGGNPGVG